MPFIRLKTKGAPAYVPNMYIIYQFLPCICGDFPSQAASVGTSSAFAYGSTFRTISSSSTFLNSSRHKGAPNYILHLLSISAAVTRIRWRPPAYDTHVGHSSNTITDTEEDLHSTMIAVATAPVKGAVAGGKGMLTLWSYRRPFMPLSVVEGHSEGAVTDFCW
jgi:WD repeat-containing protein 24